MRDDAETLTTRFMRRFCFGAALAFLSVTTAAPAAADEYFYVVNTATKMMAEVFGHNMNVGAPVVLWPHYGGDSQQFYVWDLGSHSRGPVPGGDPGFLLKAKHSGLCLKTNGYQSGAPIVQAACDGDASQLLKVKAIRLTPAECPGGQCFAFERHVLQNQYDRGKRCLDAANGAFPAPPLQGAPLQAWDCITKFSAANAVNQEWELVNVRDWNAPGPVVH